MNNVVNKEGFIIVGDIIHRYQNRMHYLTELKNSELLISENYSHPFVHSNKIQRFVPENYHKPQQVNIDGNKTKEVLAYCGNRYYRLRGTVEFNFDPFVAGNDKIVNYGFNSYGKRQKRGWTTAWYNQASWIYFSGYYQSEGKPFSSITRPPQYGSNYYVVFNPLTHTEPYNPGENVWQWARDYLNNTWAYLELNVTSDICGQKSITF